ncbi:hypothetical protein VTK26DRAFT_3305 [Humicola hyalothermophila]
MLIGGKIITGSTAGAGTAQQRGNVPQFCRRIGGCDSPGEAWGLAWFLLWKIPGRFKNARANFPFKIRGQARPEFGAGKKQFRPVSKVASLVECQLQEGAPS